jgi:phosphogluconate dehydratase
MHLVAMAHAAGIHLTWADIGELSETVPLLARIYPNGLADVNHFHAAGGTGFLIRQLLDAGLLHEDVDTILGSGLGAHAREPMLGERGEVTWIDAPKKSGDDKVLAPVAKAFRANGGLKVLSGNLGSAISKVSAVAPERHVIEAPAVIFEEQDDIVAAFKAGELEKDFVAVLRFQGPKANGMPELHRLTPVLGVLQDRGFRVALVTDGRMSGASGKVPSAIHVTPEALDGGPIAQIRDGDIVCVDTLNGRLDVKLAAGEFAARPLARRDMSAHAHGIGRELFAGMRALVGRPDDGARAFG